MEKTIGWMGILFLMQSAWTHAAERLVFMHEIKEKTPAGELESKKIILSQSDGDFDGELTVPAENEQFLYPDINADGTEVVYVKKQAQGTQSAIVWKSLLSEQTRVIAEGEGLYIHPRFSGDSKFVAFSAPFAGKAAQLHRAALDSVRSGGPVAIESIAIEGEAYFPALSVHGNFSIFQINQEKTKKLARLDWDTKQWTLLAEAGDYAMSPAIDGASEQVVFTSYSKGAWSVRIMDLKSLAVKTLLMSRFRDFAPSFCGPNSLIFASDREGSFQIYKGTLQEGSLFNIKKLTDSKGDHYAPRCSFSSPATQSLYPSVPDPARSSFGAVRIENEIFLVGGHQGHEHTYPPESFLDRVDILDLKTMRWRIGKPRPVAAHGFQVVAYQGFLYAFGGFAYEAKNSPRWRSLDQIDRYDPVKDEWTTVGKLSHPVSSNVVSVVGSKAYVLGGWDSTPQSPGDIEGRFHREVDVFDFETFKTTPSPFTLPDPLRRAMTGVTLNGKIILIGGIGVGSSHFNLLDQVTEFDPETGKWTEKSKLPFATFAPAAGVLGGDIFLFGGMWKTGNMEYNYVNPIYRFDSRADAWSPTYSFVNEPKGFSTVIGLPDALGVIGGHWYHDETDSPVSTFETFRFNRSDLSIFKSSNPLRIKLTPKSQGQSAPGFLLDFRGASHLF